MPSGIEHPDVLDLLTESSKDGVVRLIIVGPETWTGSDEEQRLLERKIRAYLDYVESGALYESYPDALLWRKMFQIDTRSPVPKATQRTIDRLAAYLRAEHEIELRLYDVASDDKNA
jgi:hypothetical protein